MFNENIDKLFCINNLHFKTLNTNCLFKSCNDNPPTDNTMHIFQLSLVSGQFTLISSKFEDLMSFRRSKRRYDQTDHKERKPNLR